MNLKTIQKGNLTIALDTDYLSYQRTKMLEIFDSLDEEEMEAMTNKKNKIITKEEYEEAVDRLFNLAIDIMDEKFGIDIWEYLPYTKAGIFHKSGTTLLATSNIKDVWNGDYFQIKMMDLRLTPVSFAEKINPFVVIGQTGNIFGKVSGDGTVAYIELDWFPRAKKEEPIFDAMNKPKKIDKVRNKYLKIEDMKPGYTYFDANGNEFLYAGNLYFSSDNWCEGDEVYTNKEDYLKSDARKRELEHRTHCEQYTKYKGSFYYLKMTKKNKKLVEDARNLEELFKVFVDNEFWDWSDKWKNLENPLKVVSEGEKIIDDTLENAFFYAENHSKYDGRLCKDFFFWEKVN